MRPIQMPMADKPRYYVALGDSISIDDYAGGLGLGGPSLLYKNQDELFPAWRGLDLKTKFPNTRFLLLAQDGATSAAVRYAQLPRLKGLGIRPSLVTLTMGGNDILTVYGNDDAARTAHKAFEENVRAVLTGLREWCGENVPIFIGTIYDPSDGTGDAASALGMPWPSAFTYLQAFNATIRAGAKQYSAILSSVDEAFHGHGLLVGSPLQREHRPANREMFYLGGIEPNGWGANALRQMWWEQLAEIQWG